MKSRLRKLYKAVGRLHDARRDARKIMAVVGVGPLAPRALCLAWGTEETVGAHLEVGYERPIAVKLMRAYRAVAGAAFDLDERATSVRVRPPERLDDDIAVLRSFSLSRKIALQTERDWRAYVASPDSAEGVRG